MGRGACTRRHYTIVHWLPQLVRFELGDWLGLNTRTPGEAPACRMVSWPLTRAVGNVAGNSAKVRLA
jgi:hypothetical protein